MASGLEMVLDVPAEVCGEMFLKATVCGAPDHPEWVADDLGNILGIKDVRGVMRNFDGDEKGVRSMHTLGGRQNKLVVTEMGFYRLVFLSRKPTAKKFRRWVCGEVLPCIRKHGCYPAPAVVKAEPVGVSPAVAKAMLDMLGDGQKVIAGQLLALTRLVETLAARPTAPEPLPAPTPSRRRTNEDKRRDVAVLLRLDPTRSDTDLADEAGVSQSFVAKRRRKLEAAGDIPVVRERRSRTGHRVPVSSRFSLN